MRPGQALYPVARRDAVPGKPAAVHFQCIQRFALRAVVIGGVGLHFIDVDDAAVGRDEGDAQRQRRVLHPEIIPSRFVEDEQHAAVGAQRIALHQSACAAVRGVGDFGVDGKFSYAESGFLCDSWR